LRKINKNKQFLGDFFKSFTGQECKKFQIAPVQLDSKNHSRNAVAPSQFSYNIFKKKKHKKVEAKTEL